MTRRPALLLTCCLAAGATLAARAPQTFKASTEAVRLDVLVTERGRPVLGLSAADFEVRDNGVRQTVEFVSFEKIPLRVMMALDLSGSVTVEGLDHLRSAGEALLDALTPDDLSGVITFNHAVVQRHPPSRDRAPARAALDDAQPEGETSLVDASLAAIVGASAVDTRGLVVVFSDGVDTSSWLSPDLVLDTARRTEVVVYGVTLGERLREDFLRDLTEATGGRLLELQSSERLRATFLQVLAEFRHRYLLSYTPRGVDGGGWHRVQVRIRGRSVTVRTRPGYMGSSSVPGP